MESQLAGNGLTKDARMQGCNTICYKGAIQKNCSFGEGQFFTTYNLLELNGLILPKPVYRLSFLVMHRGD